MAKGEMMEGKEIVRMIEILRGFTGTTERLERDLQKTLNTVKEAVKEAHGLIDEFADELSKKEVVP